MQGKFLKACAVFSAVYLFGVGAVEAATVNIVRVADNPHNTEHGIRVYGSAHMLESTIPVQTELIWMGP